MADDYRVKPAPDRKHAPRALRLALEPRFMFDAAAAVTAVAVVKAATADTGADAHDASAAQSLADAAGKSAAATLSTDAAQAGTAAGPSAATAAGPSTATSAATSAAATTNAAADPAKSTVDTTGILAQASTAETMSATPAPRSIDDVHQVVVVDTSVADYQTLIAGIDPSTPVILLGPGQRTLHGMAEALEPYSNLDQVVLVSEGGDGAVILDGTGIVAGGSLASQSADLTAIGASLKTGGDFVLLGCSIAADVTGQQFVDDFASHLGNGINVSASTNPTGPTTLGGDWVMEYDSGRPADVALPFTVAGMQDFSHTLTNTAPVLDASKSPTMTSELETSTNPLGAGLGTLVSSLVSLSGGIANVTDSDGGAVTGIAITATDTSHGVVWYTTNAGISWTHVSTVSSSSALLLAADSNTRIYYAPSSSSFTGTVSDAITFQAWDQTSGTAGTKVSASTNGGSSAFSSAADTVALNLTAPDAAPVISNLNGDSVAWVDANTAVTLDNGGNATVSDAENDVGNWNGGSLTLQRVTGGAADGSATDLFGFGAGVTSTGTMAKGSDSTGTVTVNGKILNWTYTSASGQLEVDFGSAGAATADVQALVHAVQYKDATPYGNATIRFALNDGGGATTNADVTVTSSTIYVDQTTDDASGLAANGFSLREALARGAAQSGADTIVLDNLTTSTTLTLSGSTATVGAGDTISDTGKTLTIAGATGGGLALAAGGTETVSVASSGALTVSAVISGSGALAKAGTGGLTLSGTNTYTGSTTFSAGALSTATLGSTSSLVFDGGTFKATANLSSALGITINAGGGTIDNSTGSILVSLSGAITGTGGLTMTAGATQNVLKLSGNSSFSGGVVVSSGLLDIGAANALGTGALTMNGGRIRSTAGSAVALANGLVLNTDLIMAGSVGIGFGGTVDLGGGNRSVNDQLTIAGADLTFSGVVSNGNLIVASTGAAKVILSGIANTYGNTTVTSGILSIAGAGSLGTGTGSLGAGTLLITGATTLTTNIAVTGNATIQVASGNAVTLSGNLTGSAGALTVTTGTGAGDGLTLSGTDTYSGGITLPVGTLLTSGGSAIGDTSAVTVASGAHLKLGANETIGSLAGSGNVALGAFTLTAGGSNTNIGFSGTLSGTGGLTKVGTGTMFLSGTNTYTGATSVSAGTLEINAGSAISDSSAVSVAGTLKVDVSETIASLAGAGTVTLNTATLTAGGDNTSTTFSGIIQDGTGAGALIKTGTGTLTLSGASTYSGTTTVSAGTLAANNSGALGSATGGTTVASGASLSLGSGVTVADALSIGGSGASNQGALIVSSGSATVSGGVALTAATSISVADTATLTIGGVLSGAFTFNRTIGNGTLVLTADNHASSTSLSIIQGSLSITDQTNLTGGTLTLDMGDTNVPGLTVTGTDVTIAKNIILGFSGGIITNANTLTLSGVISSSSPTSSDVALYKNGAGKLILSGTNTYSATGAVEATMVKAGTLSITSGANLGTSAVALNGGSLEVTGTGTTVGNGIILSANATITGTNSATLSGVISGAHALTTGGAGTLLLSGTNTYTGATTVSAGTLEVSGGSAIGDSSAVSVAGTLKVDTNETVGSLTGAGTVTLNGGSLTAGGDNTSGTFSGGIGGTGGLTKVGTGTLTLSGTDTYSGATAVSAGTLSVNGALNGTSGLTVASGATLGGNGSIFAPGSSNTLTVSTGGTLSPGNSPGTLTVNGNLSLSGTLVEQIAGNTAGTGYDQLVVSGAVTLNSATLSITDSYTPVGADTYTIISNTGSSAITGTFAGVAEGASLTAGGNSQLLRASSLGGIGNPNHNIVLQTATVASLSGTHTSTVNNGGTDSPFSAATFTDATSGASSYAVAIVLSANNGTLTGTGLTSTDSTHYTITASDAATLQANLRALVFTPASSAFGTATTFTLTPTDTTNGDGSADSTTIVTVINAAPTLTTTPSTPTFTENGAAVSLFSGTVAGSGDSGQNLHTLTLTVGGLANGASEILTVDGSDVALTNGNSVTTTANGYAVAVSLASGTATVAITRTGDFTAAAAQTLVNGLTYRDTSSDPTTTGGRTVTLTSIQDSGGTVGGGVDTTALSAATTVSLTAVNTAPTIAVPGAQSIADANAHAITGISIADVDAHSGTETVTLGVTSGTLVLVGSGSANVTGSNSGSVTVSGTVTDVSATLATLTYATTASGTGTDTLSLSVNDGGNTGSGGAQTGTGSVTINLTANDTPVVTVPGSKSFNDTNAHAISGVSVADTLHSGSMTATVSDLAGNLSATASGSAGITGGGTGTLTITGSLADVNATLASLAYTTTATATGSDTITIAVSDGGTSLIGGAKTGNNTIAVTLTGNDTPVVTVPGSKSFNDPSAHAISGISIADTQQGGSMTATVSDLAGNLSVTASGSAGITGGGTGTLTITGNLADVNATLASLAYTTTATATGSDTITVAVSDGGTSLIGGAKSGNNTIAVALTGNDTPVLTAPGSKSFNDTTAHVIGGISIADTLQGSAVTATVSDLAGNLGATASGSAGITGGGTGSLTITGSLADVNATLASLAYTTTATATGSDTISIAVNDGGTSLIGGAKSTSGTIAVTLTANDTPVVAVPGSKSFNDTTAHAIGGVSVSDTLQGSGVTATISDLAGNLGATASGSAGITGGGTGSLTITGSLADVNATLATLTYASTATVTGSDTITVTINDGGTSLIGGAKSGSNTIAVALTGNDTPVVTVPGSKSFNDTNAHAITGISVADSLQGSGVMATISDLAGNLSATASGSAGITGGGTGTLTITGSLADVNATLSTLTYATMATATGSDTITVAINDGGTSLIGGAKSASNTIAVALTGNDTPVVTVPGSKNFNDTNAHAITGISVADTLQGSATTATLSDLAGNLSVTASGTAAVSNSGTGSLTITGSLADVNATLATLIYATTATATGSDTITVAVSDGGTSLVGGAKSASGTIAVALTGNDTPVVTVPGSQSFNDTNIHAISGISATDTLQGSAVTATVSDLVGNLTVTASGSAGITGGGTGTLTITGSLADVNATLATLGYVTTATATGSETITVTLNDGGTSLVGGAKSANRTITVALTGNDTPVITLPGTQHFQQGNNQPITGISVSDSLGGGASTVTISDAQGGLLNLTAAGGATITGNGTASVSISGALADINTTLASLTDTPALSGSDTLTVVATDGGTTRIGGVKSATGTIAFAIDAIVVPVSPPAPIPPASLPAPPAAPTDSGLVITQTISDIISSVPSTFAPTTIQTATVGTGDAGVSGTSHAGLDGGNIIAQSLVAPTTANPSLAIPAIAPTNAGPTLDTTVGGVVTLSTQFGAGTVGLTIGEPVGNQVIAAGQTVSFQLPLGTFISSDPQVVVEARQSNGQPLPAWLQFDPASGTFTGQPPAGATGNISISVNARDSKGDTVETRFQVRLGGVQQRSDLQQPSDRRVAFSAGERDPSAIGLAAFDLHDILEPSLDKGNGRDAAAHQPFAGKPSLSAQLHAASAHHGIVEDGLDFLAGLLNAFTGTGDHPSTPDNRHSNT